MGPAIAAALADPLVIEIMVNPDGALRLDRLGDGPHRHRHHARPRPGRADHPAGRQPCARRGPCRLADRLRRAAAAWATVPASGSKGVLPPVSTGALLLDPQAGIARLHARRLCRRRHHDRRGGAGARRWQSPSDATSSSPAAPARARRRSPTRCSPRWPHLDERVILIEDTRELQCAAPDTVALRTRPGAVTHGRPGPLDPAAAPRPHHRRRGARRPKRSTCSRPGTPATPAASRRSTPTARSPRSTGSSSSSRRAVVTVPRRLIAEAIDLIVFIAGRGLARRIDDASRASTGLDPARRLRARRLSLPTPIRRRMTMPVTTTCKPADGRR